MDTYVFFIIIFASIMHITWNGMVKKYPDKVIAVSGIVFGHVPLALLAILFLPAPSIESIPYIIGSAFIMSPNVPECKKDISFFFSKQLSTFERKLLILLSYNFFPLS